MKLINYLLIVTLVVVCNVGLLVKSQGVQIWIDPIQGTDLITCGSNATSACNSLYTAFESFKNSSNVNTTSVMFHLADGTYYASKNNSNIELLGYQNIVIQPSPESTVGVVWDGESVSSLFTMIEATNETSYQTSVTMNKITFTNSFSNTTGGGIFYISLQGNQTSVTLTINECTFTSNTLDNSTTIDNNYPSKGLGSVLFFESGDNVTAVSTLSISKSVFTRSIARSAIIFIDSEQMSTSITDSEFTLNYGSSASCLFSYSAVNINQTIFQNNKVMADGGALYLNSVMSPNSIYQSTFTDNQAGNGGAILIRDAYLQLKETTFNRNSAKVRGGSIHAIGDTCNLVFNDCTFNNSVASTGGAIAQESGGSFQFSTTEFLNNEAIQGGSLYLTLQVEGTFQSTSILFSNADQGGAIYASDVKLTFLSGNQISNNIAQNGGSVFCSASVLNITGTLFQNNTDTLTSSSEEKETGGKIIPNDANIYCSLTPSFTFCTVVGEDQYTGYCGEEDIDQKKSGLSAGAIAGIVIGSIAGAAILAFGLGFVITSKVSIKSYFRALRDDMTHEEINNDDDE
ncbi:pectin lyase-like family protein [Tieghemostelium lacteum]|uniref:Pectin lyase-like family protein n=1 Tax=Tieghemostelium lacteum TaxID=361077 RepID=A0A151ZAY2_TIELA|nr:pectin lyase-like family protein [Tieghemostelium lacteum]|eukprot:KYQ91112.1 pectin lyase-like family protein [Tieghemostelium lacteum]